MKEQSLTDNDKAKSFPSGKLFSLLPKSPIHEMPEVKAYWKSRYKKYYKNISSDGATLYTFMDNTFIPLSEYDNNTGKSIVYENGQEIDLDKFLEKVRSIIAFI